MYSLKTGQSFGIANTITNLSVVFIQNFINPNFINTEEDTYTRKQSQD